MQINRSGNIDELSSKFADWMIEYIRLELAGADRFTICLSGGSTPKKLYKLLATEKFASKIDWAKMHVFWGDERYVPFEDETNNAKMAFDVLLNHVPIPPNQIHRIRTDIPPEESAKQYAIILQQYFPVNPQQSRWMTFDLTLLGLGDNAHTLSLFPGEPLIHETNSLVEAVFVKEVNSERITLTAPAVNHSKRIAFLVAGRDKAQALAQVIEGNFNPDLYPAQVIRPANGELYWFVDEAAAALTK
jgi:6-phosphogluconolactonase